MKAGYGLTAALALLLFAGNCGGNPPASTANPTASCVSSSKPSFVYVLNSNNMISSYTTDSCTGALTPTNPPSVATNANDFGSESLAVDPSGRFAYAANLMSNAADLATISMYTIDSSTGVLTPTAPATVHTGYLPQGIAIDPSGRFVYTANSDDNTVSMFTIDQSTGVLTPMSPPTVATGSSPVAIVVDRSGKFAYVANQIDGSVSMYTIDASTGVLSPTNPAIAAGGAFDVTVDPSSRFVYVPNNITNFVSSFVIDSTTGALSPTSQGALQVGMEPTNVAIDPSSKFAYVVNRKQNSISAYSIDQTTGALRLIGTATSGQQPWRAKVDSSGKFVYVGNESGSVSIYSINSDGMLTVAGSASTPAGALDISIISHK